MKPAKELLNKPFNGQAENYKIWADRIKDHFKERNSDWTHVFKMIEETKSPIWKSSQNQSTVGDGTSVSNVDYRWVSHHRWTFIGKKT